MKLDDQFDFAEMASIGLPERYKMTKLLGRGGMGSIFEAEDLVLNSKVAIKVLHQDLCMTADARIRFLREAKALATLRHSNIINIRHMGITSQGRPFQVLDFVEGETLADRSLRKNSPLSATEFESVFTQLSDALQFASQCNVIHRDIKPSNIMLLYSDEQIKAVLLDFGIAKILNDDPEKTVTGSTVPGSPPYMSPEQCRGEPLDFRSDIYSLGCVMYECLAAVQPFSGETPLEIMYKQMNEEPPRLQGITDTGSRASSMLASLIERCLRKDKQERPESFAQLKQLLREAAGSAEPAFRYTTDSVCSKPIFKTARRGAFKLMVGLAVGCCFAWSFAWLMHHRRAQEQQQIQKQIVPTTSEHSDGKDLERLIQKTSKNYRMFVQEDKKEGESSLANVLAEDMYQLARMYAAAHRYPEAMKTAKDLLTVCPRSKVAAGISTIRAHKLMGDLYSWWADEGGRVGREITDTSSRQISRDCALGSADGLARY